MMHATGKASFVALPVFHDESYLGLRDGIGHWCAFCHDPTLRFRPTANAEYGFPGARLIVRADSAWQHIMSYLC